MCVWVLERVGEPVRVCGECGRVCAGVCACTSVWGVCARVSVCVGVCVCGWEWGCVGLCVCVCGWEGGCGVCP